MVLTTIREITIGGLSKSELLQQFEARAISLNKYAAVLFADVKFQTSERVRGVKIIDLSLEEMSLGEGATSSQIFSKAKTLGLSLCPLELAAHLRLQYLEQSEGAYLTVSSSKLKSNESFPNGFYLRRSEGVLWLRGYTAASDYIWKPQINNCENRFVFLYNQS